MKLLKITLILIITLFFSACCAYKVFPGGEYHCLKVDFQDLVKDGHYRDAFNMLSPDNLESSDYGSKVSYDILNVLVNGNKIKKEDLFIYKTYKKYPNSIAWTMLSAKILVIYLDTDKVDEETVQLFEEYVPKHSKHNYFWLKALKDLQTQ